ncbi:MAG: AAA family ATPase [Pseudonocardiales bacterium]|nr:AAA family ATPase [Pseudonocardiales bacterium]
MLTSLLRDAAPADCEACSEHRTNFLLREDSDIPLPARLPDELTTRPGMVRVQSGPVPRGVPSPWPFVGRDRELQAVIDAMDSSEPGAVVVAGQAGVGRTRLAQEAVAVARRAGQPTAWATGTRASSAIPLGALAHLVPVAATSSTPAAMLHHAVTALTGSADEPTLVVGIDDAHLLDELSAALLHKIVLTRSACVVLTVCSGAPAPELVSALWQDGLTSRIELAPLSDSQVAQLLSAGLGGIVGSRTSAELSRMSCGSAALLQELVQAGHETTRLRVGDGVWRWGAVAPTQRLIEVVRAQIGELNADEECALELLAVGGSLGLAEVVEVTSSEAVAALERRGLVTAERVSRRTEARLAQPLHGEVLRAQMPQEVARQLRRRLAGDIARQWRIEDPIRAGVLLLAGDGPYADPGVLATAAAHANAERDHGLAERLARAAVEDGAGCAAHVALVEAVRCQGRPVEAERLAMDARQLAVSADEAAHLGVTRALNLFYGLGRAQDAVSELDAVAASGATDPASCTALAARALLSFSAGRPREAAELAAAVLVPAAAGAAGVGARVLAAAALTGGLAVLGRTEAALAAAASGWAAAEGRVAEPEISMARLALAQSELLALESAGHVRRAELRAAQLHGASLAQPGPGGDGMAVLGLGSAALAAGRLATAVRWLTEAAALLVDGDPAGCLPRCRAQLAQAHALLGHRVSAARLLDVNAAAGRCAVRVFEPEDILAQAWHSAAEQRIEEAADRAVHAASVAARMDQPLVEANALYAVVRLGRAAEVTDRLRQLAGLVEGALVPAFVAHADAVTRGLGDRLDQVAAEFESQGAWLLAVDASAHAAQAHERAGRRRPAGRSANRSADLARGCDGVQTPARAQLAPLLTRREQQVATLAANGASNQEIADLLVLSVRTIETHLARAYRKLGIGSRIDLGLLLVGAPER